MTLAPYIDHTLLKVTATHQDIQQLCQQAREYHFRAVCINPQYIKLCKAELSGSNVGVATVCGFPLGALTSEQKALEARLSAEAGADEIDMVMAIGSALEGDWDYVQQDIRAVRRAVPDKTLKVIIETCYLNDEQKRKAVAAAVYEDADFVKTSTGFGTGGATLEDVRLMAEVLRHMGATDVQIKAAGGVRTPEDAYAFIAAGATRLGTSGGVGLMAGQGAALGAPPSY